MMWFQQKCEENLDFFNTKSVIARKSSTRTLCYICYKQMYSFDWFRNFYCSHKIIRITDIQFDGYHYSENSCQILCKVSERNDAVIPVTLCVIWLQEIVFNPLQCQLSETNAGIPEKML